MRCLSPESLHKVKRKVDVKFLRMRVRGMIRKYAPEEITLDDQKHVEMYKNHSSLDNIASMELEFTFTEGII